MESSIDKVKQKLKELEAIPLCDPSGGRQRSSKENQLIIKYRIILEKLENA